MYEEINLIWLLLEKRRCINFKMYKLLIQHFFVSNISLNVHSMYLIFIYEYKKKKHTFSLSRINIGIRINGHNITMKDRQ